MTTTPRHPRTDHSVKAAILAELDWMPNIQADRIGVAISDGAVTLSGQVESYPEKHGAVLAAFRVRGVTAVADEIEVHNTRLPRTDADVARDAGNALERTVKGPVGSVKAAVHDHVVTLTGTVGWHYEREAIGHTIAMLPGVHGVSNRITLKPAKRVSPIDAKEKIAEALQRNASIEAEHIAIDVVDDRITLSGVVGSWEELTQAGRAAWATPGVTDVRNELHIRR